MEDTDLTTAPDERNEELQEAQEAEENGSCSEKQGQFEQELAQCRQEQERLQDQYARVAADLANYRRRVAKDQAMWARTAQDQVLLELLNVLDNFDRALEQGVDQASDEVKAWLSGFEIIHSSLLKTIDDFGITEMAAQDTFNPEYHEAIAQVASDEHEADQIVAVMQKGYLRDGVVLRHARVSVAQ